MKRKVLGLVLGMTMVLSSSITAMAAEAPMDMAVATTVSMEAVEITESSLHDFNLKEGLSVNLFDNANQDSKAYFGTISQSDMEKITSELKLSDEDTKEIMKKFEGNIKLQDSKNLLFSEITENTTVDDINKIYDKADDIDSQMAEIFTGKVLDKALEFNLLTEAFLSICTPALDSIEIIDLSTTDEISKSGEKAAEVTLPSKSI